MSPDPGVTSAAIVALLSGCAAIAPGLHMSESAVEGRGTAERPVRIVVITPTVLTTRRTGRKGAPTPSARVAT